MPTKPKPPTYNGHAFTPSERRAILTAATKGHVLRAGKLGSGGTKDPRYKLSYVTLGVLRKLHSKGVMVNGSGYGQHKLTNDFRCNCLPSMEYFFTQEAEWLEERAERKAKSAERKARKQATEKETAK